MTEYTCLLGCAKQGLIFYCCACFFWHTYLIWENGQMDTHCFCAIGGCPGWTPQKPTKISPTSPPFFTRGKKSQILTLTPLVFRAPPIRTGGLFWKFKKCVKDRWWAYLMVLNGWGWVPPTLRTDGPMGTPKWAPKGKMVKLLSQPCIVPFRWNFAWWHIRMSPKDGGCQRWNRK